MYFFFVFTFKLQFILLDNGPFYRPKVFIRLPVFVDIFNLSLSGVSLSVMSITCGVGKSQLVNLSS